MIFGVQYYRPPFPEKRFWEHDMRRISESGFTTVQLWIHWGWVEPSPGRYRFDDYDELIGIAKREGLSVLLSLSAELQPYWIHRAIPGSEMIDHMGNRVVSSNRGEAHQGMTPGGCTDNPAVWRCMKAFLQETAAHFAPEPSLVGWDCWNELRWNVQSNGLVCYCGHTLAAFREWLDREYGGLEGLNRAWKRRYGCWEDVFPGSLPERPYTEIIAFERFNQDKIDRHLQARVAAIREVDPEHVISAHDGGPPSLYSWGKLGAYGSGQHMVQACHTGNMFRLASRADTFGTSHYPGFQTGSLAEFNAGIVATRSAAGSGDFWVSEIQGAWGDLDELKRWYWLCLAHGAKALIAWSWRPEVFGREAGGLGIFDYTPSTEQRLELFRELGQTLEAHADAFNTYRPDEAQVAVYHDVQTYNLEWAASGGTDNTMYSLKGYTSALGNAKISYRLVDSDNICLDGVKLLILHRPVIVPEGAAEAILGFVRNGGLLLLEGDADSFDVNGFYRYAGPDRTFAHALGADSLPARQVATFAPYYRLTTPPARDRSMSFELRADGETFSLLGEDIVSPLSSGDEVLAESGGSILAVRNRVGLGSVVAIGGLLGKAYHRQRYEDFERFLGYLAREAGAAASITITGAPDVFWQSGLAGKDRLLFLINDGQACRADILIPNESYSRAAALPDESEIPLSSGGNETRFRYNIPKGGAALIRLIKEQHS